MNSIFAVKDGVSPKEIKDFRKLNKLSKLELSNLLNVSIRTIESWESSKKGVKGPIVLLLKMLTENPEYIEKMRIPEMKYPLRFLYMEDNQINTIIDVDILNRKVEFKNFTNNVIKRAFGAKEEVTYEDYEYFLDSRCIPSTRDKLKIELEMKKIPFFDKLMIIEETEGRIADDHYYIKIIRGKNDRTER